MLWYFTIVNVVFPSSPCSISIVFNMFGKFASVCLQLHTCHPSSLCGVHPLARMPWTRKMKNWACSTFRLLECLCFIKYKCKGWITVHFQDLSTWGQLFVSMWQHLWQHHPAGTWAIHLKICWIEGQNTYVMQTTCNWRNMKSIPSTLQSTFLWFSSQKLPLLTVVCHLEALKNKRSSGTRLAHPSSSTPPIKAEIFWKNRKYIYTLSGSSEYLWHKIWRREMRIITIGIFWWNAAFEEGFWYGKTYVDALWTNKTYTEYVKTYHSLMLIQDVPFLRIFNHKTYLSYI